MSTTRDKDRYTAMRLGMVDVHDRATFAAGCAHRDRQVVAYLRELSRNSPSQTYSDITSSLADAIERGEHVK